MEKRLVKGNASKRIRELRKNKGWSQSILATMAGVSLRTIQRAEKDGSASTETLKALTSVFELASHNELLRDAVVQPQAFPTHKREPFAYSGEASALPDRSLTDALFMFSVIFLAFAYMGKLDQFMFISPIAISAVMTVLFFYTLISLLRLRREERNDELTISQHIFNLSSASSLEGYMSKYPFEKNAMMIGEVKVSSFFDQLIRHTHPSNRGHMIAFGECGSGHHVVMLSQIFNMLSEHRSGLIILDERDAFLVYYLSSMLSFLGRNDDLHVHNVDSLAQWDQENWHAMQQSRSVVVGVSNQDAKQTHALALDFMNSVNPENWLSIKVPGAYDGVFLWVNDQHIVQHNEVISVLKDVSLYGRLQLVLSVTEPERFLSRGDAGAIISHFPHRYVKKIHNPNTVKGVHQALSADLYGIDTNPLRTMSFAPGEGDYFFSGTAYENVRFVYLQTHSEPLLKNNNVHIPLRLIEQN
jgi:transcriptional regulator with XRE-family HTH domain